VASQRILAGDIKSYRLGASAAAAGKYIRDLELPEHAVALMVLRDTRPLAPRGNVLLQPGDFVYVYAPDEEQEKVKSLLAGE
jgi:cell volume regulation protein A